MRLEKLIGVEEQEVQRLRYRYNLFVEILKRYGVERDEEVVRASEESNGSCTKVIRPPNKAIHLNVIQPEGLVEVEIFSVLPLGTFPVVIEFANSNKRIVVGDNLKLTLKAIPSLIAVEDVARFSLIEYARDPVDRGQIIRNAKRATMVDLR